MITVGEVLKKQRKNLGKTLEQVALDTKIQLRFLEYIEKDTFDKFDSPVFAQGFIKIYAKYLDLNEDRILAIYRRSVPQNIKPQSTRETKEKRKLGNLNITPKLLIVSLSILFLLGILSYIGYQIYQFQSPPQISISTPENDLTVTEETIDVMGVTDSNTSVFVNDKPVEITSSGEFQYLVELNPGVNLITVLAKKNGSAQESVETIKINYTVDNETEIEEEIVEEEKPNMVRLEIVNSSVWVQFNVDKINKLSQIVQVGEEYEYEVNKQFSLTTGIINSTKVFFNDEELPVSTGASSVGSLNCEIINKDQINCQ
jgi:cytoskeleton protein RodZ